MKHLHQLLHIMGVGDSYCKKLLWGHSGLTIRPVCLKFFTNCESLCCHGNPALPAFLIKNLRVSDWISVTIFMLWSNRCLFFSLVLCLLVIRSTSFRYSFALARKRTTTMKSSSRVIDGCTYFVPTSDWYGSIWLAKWLPESLHERMIHATV